MGVLPLVAGRGSILLQVLHLIRMHDDGVGGCVCVCACVCMCVCEYICMIVYEHESYSRWDISGGGSGHKTNVIFTSH